jgi:CheY-like chemotaxis protein
MKRQILIVDDEPEVTNLVRLILETDAYYTVREVNDASSALKIAREFQPDLVLMDIMMPGIDGSELAGLMLEDKQLQQVPVVFLTALVDRKETFAEADWFLRGGRTFLPKPFSAEQLLGCVKEKLSVASA